jgi:hypothetical protein
MISSAFSKQIGSVIHKNMQGGLIGGNKPIALTGFILISLLEAGRSPTVSITTSYVFVFNH